MKFKVLSEREIKGFTYNEKYIVISIRSPHAYPVELKEDSNRLGVLQLAFSDIDRVVDHPKAVLMTKEQAKQILGFYSFYKAKVDTVVVNCEAGISRSSAVAASLAKTEAQDDSEFFKKYLPNRFVYKLILEEYNK